MSSSFKSLFENVVIDQGVDEDSTLDIFEMTTKTNEPAKEYVNKELIIFWSFQVDAKDIKCVVQ